MWSDRAELPSGKPGLTWVEPNVGSLKGVTSVPWTLELRWTALQLRAVQLYLVWEPQPLTRIYACGNDGLEPRAILTPDWASPEGRQD